MLSALGDFPYFHGQLLEGTSLAMFDGCGSSHGSFRWVSSPQLCTSGRLAPTKIPLKSPGLVHPPTRSVGSSPARKIPLNASGKKSGWWLGHPSEKYEFVNWDDDIPN